MPHSVGGGKGVGPGPVNPRKFPYYLLIVGDPVEVPYRFQYELDVDYAVGRLSFETVQEYADYAAAVVAAETGDTRLDHTAVFFGTRNRNDRSTTIHADRLIRPLPEMVAANAFDWNVEAVLGENATKSGLLEVMGGERTPSVLFTASHGMVFPSGDPHQPRRRGPCSARTGPAHSRARAADLRQVLRIGR